MSNSQNDINDNPESHEMVDIKPPSLLYSGENSHDGDDNDEIELLPEEPNNFLTTPKIEKSICIIM